MSRGDKYIFDGDDFNVKKEERKAVKVLKRIAVLLAASISLTVVYYLGFSVFFSTEKERRLRQENRMIERMYPELQEKADLLSDVVEGLRQRDNDIYMEVFNTEAPDMDRLLAVEHLPLADSLDGEGIVKLTEIKADMLLKTAHEVDANFARIFELYCEEGFSMPPMNFPLKDVSVRKTGASTGKKINPFYKVSGRHTGIDLFASIGDSVLVTADGVVSKVTRSSQGLGNVVEIDHGNGYYTRYGHLTDIKVRQGSKVKSGDLVGRVGMTGRSFAPHLHYEVRKDTTIMDPVNFFFASVNPYEYAGMFMLSTMTGQSLD